MEDTKAFTLKRSGKPTFFYCHRHFLDMSHAFRRSRSKFRKRKTELDPPPPRRNSEEIWSRVRDYPKIVDLHTIARDKPKRPEGYGVIHIGIDGVFSEIYHIGRHFYCDTILMSCTQRRM